MVQVIDSFSGQYKCFSNFYYHCHLTNEHLFQAEKTLLPQSRALILSAPSPRDAKRLGRNVVLRPNWDNLRDEVMYMLLGVKFSTQFSDIRLILYRTGDALLIEGNRHCDQHWGDCRCPKHKDLPGENMLGQLLMRLRSTL